MIKRSANGLHSVKPPGPAQMSANTKCPFCERSKNAQLIQRSCYKNTPCSKLNKTSFLKYALLLMTLLLFYFSHLFACRTNSAICTVRFWVLVSYLFARRTQVKQVIEVSHLHSGTVTKNGLSNRFVGVRRVSGNEMLIEAIK